MRDKEVLAALQVRLKITFRDESLLLRALRHRSASLELPRDSYERIEFLGDSIVGMVVCDYLFAAFPQSSEGDLAKAKAYLVSEPTLAEAGLALGLGEAVELSVSEEASGGRLRRSIIADAFEAIVAAVYLDQGIRSARRLVRTALQPAMGRVAKEGYQRDFKSQLQERTQAEKRKTPHYKIVATKGADHNRQFVAHAMVGTKAIGEGEGRSKKEAEQAAAQDALTKMADKQSSAKKPEL
jgi:ribonuclease-3